MKKSYILIIVLGIIAVIVAAIFYSNRPTAEVQAIAACIESGGAYEVLTNTCIPKTVATIPPATPGSKPVTPVTKPQDQTVGGIVYSPASSTRIIRVKSPVVNATLAANVPITISGEAVGQWFFESTFPLKLISADGKLIATGLATAQGNWMTTNFVPFYGTISYSKQIKGSKGFVVLERDNPSDLRENDASVTIPVTFQ